jgi:glycosyltransferase involved in cell wall biosynthesis
METLHDLVEELGAQSYVHLMGELTDEEKYQLLITSDFFLLPNHSARNTDFEGFGISFIEASYFGNVVIGGKHGGVKEAVSDGTTGFLFDFDEPDSMAMVLETIYSLIQEPERMEFIKLRGTAFVAEKYDWNNLIENFLEFEKDRLC